MVTREQALKLTPGTILHYTGWDGYVMQDATCGAKSRSNRWRVNGQPKRWKSRPDEFRVPIKFGLRSYDYLTHHNAHEFHLESECPA